MLLGDVEMFSVDGFHVLKFYIGNGEVGESNGLVSYQDGGIGVYVGEFHNLANLLGLVIRIKDDPCNVCLGV